MSALKRRLSVNWWLVALFGLVAATAASALTPTCRSGYKLETGGSKCVRESTPICPDGYSWVPGGTCRAVAKLPSSCPNGWTMSTGLGKCLSTVEPTCPEGYSYGSVPGSGGKKTCNKTQTPTCPNKFYWSASSNGCIATTTSTNHSCPAGSSYNPGKKMCEESIAPSCPVGYTLSSGQCTKRMTTYH